MVWYTGLVCAALVWLVMGQDVAVHGTEIVSQALYLPKSHPFPSDIIYLKIDKTGSSVTGGITRAIAYHHNVLEYLPDTKGTPCGARVDCVERYLDEVADILEHKGQPRDYYVALANHGIMHPFMIQDFPGAFRWTVVRDPVSRWFSSYCYFGGGHNCGTGTSAQHIRNKLAKSPLAFQQNYIKGSTDTVQEALAQFHLIVPLDRYHEGLVALMMILDIEMGDILYVKTKVNNKQSAKIDKKKLSEQGLEWSEVEELIKERGKNSDGLLYNLASETFDAQVKSLQGYGFDEKLVEYEKHQNAAKEYCSNVGREKALGRWRDNGCKYKCLDEYAVKEGILQPDKVDQSPFLGNQQLEQFMSDRRTPEQCH